MNVLYHMLPANVWRVQPQDTPYLGDTLATEGFIHCTGERALLVTVANNFYRTIDEPFVILCIAADRVTAEVRWEPADGHVFPHIYGPLNLDAVTAVIDFPRGTDGAFTMPSVWSVPSVRG